MLVPLASPGLARRIVETHRRQRLHDPKPRAEVCVCHTTQYQEGVFEESPGTSNGNDRFLDIKRRPQTDIARDFWARLQGLQFLDLDFFNLSVLFHACRLRGNTNHSCTLCTSMKYTEKNCTPPHSYSGNFRIQHTQ